MNALSASYNIANNSWRPFRKVPLKLEIYENLEGRHKWGETVPIVKTSKYVWSLICRNVYKIYSFMNIFLYEFYDWIFVTGLTPLTLTVESHTSITILTSSKIPSTRGKRFESDGNLFWREPISPARTVIVSDRQTTEKRCQPLHWLDALLFLHFC